MTTTSNQPVDPAPPVEVVLVNGELATSESLTTYWAGRLMITLMAAGSLRKLAKRAGYDISRWESYRILVAVSTVLYFVVPRPLATPSNVQARTKAAVQKWTAKMMSSRAQLNDAPQLTDEQLDAVILKMLPSYAKLPPEAKAAFRSAVRKNVNVRKDAA